MSRLWLIPICLIIMVESLAKGWLTLILAPALIIVLPILITLFILSAKQLGRTHSRLHAWSVWILVGAVLAAYIFAVGFGDTDDVVLFGFYAAKLGDRLTTVSDALSLAGLILAPISALSTVICLFLGRRIEARAME